MARPITWQDVVAPNQAGVLAAAAQASRQITGAIGGLGDLGMDLRDQAREEATRAAVAAITNAANPMAAAALAPQGWQVDPLAIATAAQKQTDVLGGRDIQRRQGLAADASLASNQYRLEADKLTDQAAAGAQGWLNRLRAGEDVKPVFGNDALGLKEQELFEQGRNAFLDDKRADAALNLQGRQARAAEEALKMTQAQREAQNQMAAYMASPEGTGANATEVRREAERIAKVTGAGAAFAVPLATNIGTDAYRGAVSPEELAQSSPGGITYEKPLLALQAKNSQLNSEFNAFASQFDVATAAATAMATNDYKNMSPGAINANFLKNNPSTGDGLLAIDWDVNDVQQRRDHQAKLASKESEGVARELGIKLPKDFTPLTPAQEANLVELTIGSYAGITGTSDGVGSDTDAAAALRKSYIALNLFGGQAEIDKRKSDAAAAFQKQIDQNNAVGRKVGAAARTRDAIPEEALNVYDLMPDRQAEIAAKREEWSFLEPALRQLSK